MTKKVNVTCTYRGNPTGTSCLRVFTEAAVALENILRQVPKRDRIGMLYCGTCFQPLSVLGG
jgi:hypothetical protein